MWRYYYFKRLPSFRCYHYDADVYGYRLSSPPTETLFTKKQIQNRNNNPNLLRLVQFYRTEGHKLANLDPLGLSKIETEFEEFSPAYYELLDDHSYCLSGIFEHSFSTETATISNIVAKLKSIYCGRLGFEYDYIPVTKINLNHD
jgi:probable 2-oxoglutarate dehydrogenase E1 component DHKTD1